MTGVDPGGASAAAGLQAGDIITSELNGQSVVSTDELGVPDRLSQKPGDKGEGRIRAGRQVAYHDGSARDASRSAARRPHHQPQKADGERAATSDPGGTPGTAVRPGANPVTTTRTWLSWIEHHLAGQGRGRGFESRRSASPETWWTSYFGGHSRSLSLPVAT